MRGCELTLNQALRLSFLLAAVSGCSTAPDDRAASEASGAAAASADFTAANASPATTAPAELCAAELGATEPVHMVGNIYLAGQPQRNDLDELAQRGVKTIVSLRKPEELDWDEAVAVEAAGMEFIAVPFDGAEELTDDVFARVQEVLAGKSDEPLVLHCGRANRVGAVWMVHRVLNDGVGIDQALDEAKTAGLRTPEYIEKAMDYIRRKQKAHAASGESVNAESEM
jgi:uncharacterized protein (TIGR01244 family)